MNHTLTVGRFQERSEVLGPGIRAVVWFHGCTLRCPACIAKEMNEAAEFEVWEPVALAKRVIAVRGVEGITLSGGDPFDQPAEALGVFLEAVRRHGDFSVMCYTGKTLAQVLSMQPKDVYSRILRCIDVLVDGPYVDGLNDGSMWRGSANQQVHFLSPRYAQLESMVRASKDRRVEVKVGQGGEIEITGIPPRGFMDTLQKRLSERGLNLEFALASREA